MSIPLSRTARLLFIGDSITDCSRNECPEKLGSGYVRIVRDYLRAKDPASAPQVINKGISGHKVTNLRDRWGTDVIDQRPDILSIKVGINDVWHGLAGRNAGVGIDEFTAVYRDLLAQVKAKLPKCVVVLCEPSVIWPPAPEDGNGKLPPYVSAVNALAGEFGARSVVPLHGAFNRARELRPDIDWTRDGVHPTSVGHMLIARTWLTSTGLL